MFSFSWLRRAKPAPAPSDLQHQLTLLEKEAATARDEVLGRLLNRAGDLCAQAEQRPQAMAYYGRAIDAYLAAGFMAPAAAMCHKLIRYSPTVVRAHCTLAFLALADRQLGDAAKEIAEYVAAAQRAGTQKLAAPRLRMMAKVTAVEAIKRQIAEHLEELGDVLGSRRVLAELGEPLADAPPTPHAADGFWAEDEQWDRLVQAAVMESAELWKQA